MARKAAKNRSKGKKARRAPKAKSKPKRKPAKKPARKSAPRREKPATRTAKHGALAAKPKAAPPRIAAAGSVKAGAAKPGPAKTAAKAGAAKEAPGKQQAPGGKSGSKAGAYGKGSTGDLGHHEMEMGPPARVPHADPPIPTPSRRKPKPGSPDWPGESLTVGMEAPDFSLPSTLGRRITLSEFRGRRVVLYFYPKDDTPGCTMEACAFRDNLPRIEAKDAVILGISLDDELSHQRFAQKYNLPFPLLSDVDAAVCRKYGTYKEKNLYGRSFWGIERTTFVIDREGKVENVFRRVKVEGHADEVLATLSV